MATPSLTSGRMTNSLLQRYQTAVDRFLTPCGPAIAENTRFLRSARHYLASARANTTMSSVNHLSPSVNAKRKNGQFGLAVASVKLGSRRSHRSELRTICFLLNQCSVTLEFTGVPLLLRSARTRPTPPCAPPKSSGTRHGRAFTPRFRSEGALRTSHHTVRGRPFLGA